MVALRLDRQNNYVYETMFRDISPYLHLYILIVAIALLLFYLSCLCSHLIVIVDLLIMNPYCYFVCFGTVIIARLYCLHKAFVFICSIQVPPQLCTGLEPRQYECGVNIHSSGQCRTEYWWTHRHFSHHVGPPVRTSSQVRRASFLIRIPHYRMRQFGQTQRKQTLTRRPSRA